MYYLFSASCVSYTLSAASQATSTLVNLGTISPRRDVAHLVRHDSPARIDLQPGRALSVPDVQPLQQLPFGPLEEASTSTEEMNERMSSAANLTIVDWDIYYAMLILRKFLASVPKTYQSARRSSRINQPLRPVKY